MKRPYKVLSLPSWAKPRKDPMLERSFLVSIRCYNPIDPIFNRNGYYYDRMAKRAWIERNGKAWVTSASGFEWDLKYSDNEPRLEPRVYDAIEVLIEAKLTDSRLWVLYYLERQARNRRQRRIDTFKLMKRASYGE